MYIEENGHKVGVHYVDKDGNTIGWGLRTLAPDEQVPSNPVTETVWHGFIPAPSDLEKPMDADTAACLGKINQAVENMARLAKEVQDHTRTMLADLKGCEVPVDPPSLGQTFHEAEDAEYRRRGAMGLFPWHRMTEEYREVTEMATKIVSNAVLRKHSVGYLLTPMTIHHIANMVSEGRTLSQIQESVQALVDARYYGKGK